MLESFFENIPRAMEASEANPFGVSIFIIALSIILSIIFFSRASIKVRISIFIIIGITSFFLVLITHAVQFGEFQGRNQRDQFDFPVQNSYPPVQQPQPVYGSACYTSFGSCPLYGNFPVNSSCTCSNVWNTFPGTVGRW